MSNPFDPRFRHLPEVFEADESHPEIDDFTMRARRHKARQSPPVQLTSEVPVRRSPVWSGNNELGIELPYQPDGDGFQTILKMDEWGFPELWTVSLGISYDLSLVPGIGDGKFSIDGLIRFGSGGVTQEFEVDWTEGVTFTVPMNAINVIARYSDFTGKNNTPPDLRLRVNLGRNGSIPHIPPTKTTFVDDAPILGVPVVVPIPRFARRLRVQRGTGLSVAAGAWAPLMEYRFQGNATSGDCGSFTGDEYLNHFASEGVPIPPAARVVTVRNGTAATADIWMIFDLAF